MRLALTKTMNEADSVELEVCLPQDDLSQYTAQRPLKLRGRICWQRFDDGKNQCGIAFEGMSEDEKRKLRECFEYFNKTPEFSSGVR
jgi:methyl-accepting chemotaxis protein